MINVLANATDRETVYKFVVLAISNAAMNQSRRVNEPRASQTASPQLVVMAVLGFIMEGISLLCWRSAQRHRLP